MKSFSEVIWVLLTITLAVGLLGCHDPTFEKGLPESDEKHVKTDLNSLVTIQNNYRPMVRPAFSGRVWLNTRGEAIGIVFSAPEGDFCESKDGMHMGFIRWDEPDKRFHENQVKKRVALNSREPLSD